MSTHSSILAWKTPWTEEPDSQQAETVVIHHIITRGTVDEDVMQSLSEKDRSQAALMRAVRARVEARK